MQRKLLGVIRVDFNAYILHSSNTSERMGIQGSNASALYRCQKSLLFSYEGGLHSVWHPHETGIAAKPTVVRVGKHFSDMFHVKNALKKGYALLPLLFKFAL
jgi:hypothetical protein